MSNTLRCFCTADGDLGARTVIHVASCSPGRTIPEATIYIGPGPPFPDFPTGTVVHNVQYLVNRMSPSKRLALGPNVRWL